MYSTEKVTKKPTIRKACLNGFDLSRLQWDPEIPQYVFFSFCPPTESALSTLLSVPVISITVNNVPEGFILYYPELVRLCWRNKSSPSSRGLMPQSFISCSLGDLNWQKLYQLATVMLEISGILGRPNTGGESQPGEFSGAFHCSAWKCELSLLRFFALAIRSHVVSPSSRLRNAVLVSRRPGELDMEH